MPENHTDSWCWHQGISEMTWRICMSDVTQTTRSWCPFSQACRGTTPNSRTPGAEISWENRTEKCWIASPLRLNPKFGFSKASELESRARDLMWVCVSVKRSGRLVGTPEEQRFNVWTTFSQGHYSLKLFLRTLKLTFFFTKSVVCEDICPPVALDSGTGLC